MPPIFGLYTSLLPTALYAFFGSSMQLTVGPTALISLMTGSLLSKYGVDSTTDLEAAIDTCAQASFCVGITILVLGLLNLGSLINFMSHPVMAGFTTGAALTIGMTQLRSAFGFALTPPQQGGDVDHNYQVFKWWSEHWNDTDADGHQLRNFYAVRVSLFRSG
jgi:SulP family sulfate permease